MCKEILSHSFERYKQITNTHTHTYTYATRCNCVCIRTFYLIFRLTCLVGLFLSLLFVAKQAFSDFKHIFRLCIFWLACVFFLFKLHKLFFLSTIITSLLYLFLYSTWSERNRITRWLNKQPCMWKTTQRRRKRIEKTTNQQWISIYDLVSEEYNFVKWLPLFCFCCFLICDFVLVAYIRFFSCNREFVRNSTRNHLILLASHSLIVKWFCERANISFEMASRNFK